MINNHSRNRALLYTRAMPVLVSIKIIDFIEFQTAHN